jgi:hypothetical protein
MRKYLVPILAGFGVALVVGLFFGALLGPGLLTMLPAAFIGMFTFYILANLAGNRKVAPAGEAERAQALTFQAPPDQALVYVYRDGFVGMAAGLNLAVDGREVAQLKSPRFVCLPLPPGPHTLTAGFGGLAGPQNKLASFELRAAAGAIMVLKVGISMGLLQNKLTFTPQPDLAAAKSKLSGMVMVASEGSVPQPGTATA